MVSSRRIPAELHDDFIVAVEHDLRVPVANILGFVDLLRSGADMTFSAEQIGYLERIEANCQTLLAMCEDLARRNRSTQ